MAPAPAPPFGLALFLAPCFLAALAQQSYYQLNYTADCTNYHPENAGYVCEPSSPTCSSSVYFRVQSTLFSSLGNIADSLFDFSNASSIASYSNLQLSSAAPLALGQGLFIPLSCGCHGNYSSQNTNYTIRPGDTFLHIANSTYDGLTTCQAVQTANPDAIVTNLYIDQQIVVPLRCACPSQQQRNRGIKLLMTYPVAAWDNISSLLHMFPSVDQKEFLAANSLSEMSQQLFEGTTVLLPLREISTVPPNSFSFFYSQQTGSSESRVNAKVWIGVAVATAFIFLLFVGARLAWIKKIRQTRMAERNGAKKLDEKFKMEQSYMPVAFSGFCGPEKWKIYTLDEIKQATQDFSSSNHIKGAVYRGVIEGRVVAVKHITRNVSKELQILQKVHHASLLTLLGACVPSTKESYLVYEYAENGSLFDWLHENEFDGSGRSMSTLSWNNRLQIAFNVATALEYIHDHTSPSYVHKDVKSRNILLDHKLRGKLANFGLAESSEDVDPTRHIVGTRGYMAPEYLAHGTVSTKVDVFAFGVVLLEILSGKEAIIMDGGLKKQSGREMFMSQKIGQILKGDGARRRLREWMDARLQNAYPLECAFKLAAMASSCVADEPAARPRMRDVAYSLAKLVEASLEWEPSMEDLADLEAR